MNNMCVLDCWVGYDYKSITLPAELQGHNRSLLRNLRLIKNFFSKNLNDETQSLHYLRYLSFLHPYLCQS
jgi:hypothetical protein